MGSPCLLLPWLLAKLLSQLLLATFPDWSLALRLPDSGGLPSSCGPSSKLIMWARGKLLSGLLVCLLLSAPTIHSVPLSCWICEHCWIPCWSVCRCLPWIPLLLDPPGLPRPPTAELTN